MEPSNDLPTFERMFGRTEMPAVRVRCSRCMVVHVQTDSGRCPHCGY